MDELATTKLLIIDEVQERAESGFENRLLTHLIDARYAAMRPTIIIANLAKRELAAEAWFTSGTSTNPRYKNAWVQATLGFRIL